MNFYILLQILTIKVWQSMTINMVLHFLDCWSKCATISFVILYYRTWDRL